MKLDGPIYAVVNAGSGRNAAEEKVALLRSVLSASGRPFDVLVADDRDHEATTDTRYVKRLVDAGRVRLEDVVDLAEIVSGARPGRRSPPASVCLFR